MDVAIQEEYLRQYSHRKKEEIFAKESSPLLGERWQLVDYYHTDQEHALRCEFPHENGKICGKNIQHIYTIRSESGKYLKVGGTCLTYIVNMKKLAKVDRDIKRIRSRIDQVNGQYGWHTSQPYTKDEQVEILQRAEKENLLPSDVNVLFKEGVPLPLGVYSQLQKALQDLERNRELLAASRYQPFASNPIYPRMNIRNEDSNKNGLKDYVKQALADSGPYSLQVNGDVKKAIEVTVQAHLHYAAQHPLRVRKFSELLEPIEQYYHLDGDAKRKLRKKTYAYTLDLLTKKYELYVKEDGEEDFFIRFF